jgi:hypothetical protein
VPKNALAPDDGKDSGNPLLNAVANYWQSLNNQARQLPAFNPVQNGQLSPFAQSVVGNTLGFVGGIGDAPVNRLLAYHGSPHSFDAFDSSKIGTGEGAQAYGHGLYFAENEGVARSYRDALAPPRDWMDIAPDEIAQTQYAKQWDGLVQKRRAAVGQDLRGDPSAIDAQMNDLHDKMVKETIARNPGLINSGSMYQVGINANPDHFLDWDKPLSEQHPVVQQALSKVGVSVPEYSIVPGDNGWAVSYKDSAGNPQISARTFPTQDAASQAAIETFKMRGQVPTGGGIVENLTSPPYGERGYGVNDPVSAAKKLQQAGIPGIKYLDGGSRGAGQGTSNYVVFDPSTIDILRKYGIAGLGIGGAGASQLPDPTQSVTQPMIPGS